MYYPEILELKDEYFSPEIQEERKRIRKAAEAEEPNNKKLDNPVEPPPQEEKKKAKKGKKKTDGVKVKIHEQTEEEKKELHSFKNLEKYELLGVIVHKGKDIQKGHYVAFVQDSYGNWILYDDKDYKPVTPNIVLDQQAYVLIYRKFT